MSPDFPSEIWAHIFASCALNDITLVCKRWTNIAYSSPALWTRIRIASSQCTNSGLAFLNDRLFRAGTCPLDIEICIKSTVHPTILRSICVAIASHSAVKSLQISVATARIAGQIFKDLALRNPSIPHTLQRLCFKVDTDADRNFTPRDPYPSFLLAPGGDLLPALRSLTLPTYWPCLPIIPSTSSNFDHLATLIIYGAFPVLTPCIYVVCSILHHTPRLQTLWFKSQDVFSYQPVRHRSTLSIPAIVPELVSIPVFLPRLTCISVTVTGSGADILSCIDAPVLRDLHLDGSRSIWCADEWPSDFDYISYTLQRVALHSPGLRRLAVTETSLSERIWRWILSGDPLEGDLAKNAPGNVPFPHLESLSVRDLPETRDCGLTDVVLLRYAIATGVIPRCLVLRHCESISGMVLLQVARSVQKKNALELQIVACPNVDEEQVITMRSIGVNVNWEADGDNLGAESRVAEQEWWADNQVFLERERELTPDQWERVVPHDECPWWIFDTRPFDSTDS